MSDGNISGMRSPATPVLRIDHLLLSPAVAGRLIGAGVDREVRAREKSSDHAPVWIELADRSRLRDGGRVSRAVSRRGQPSSAAIGLAHAATGLIGRNSLLMGMHPPSYYRKQAEHVRRMARLMHQPDLTETLLRMAQDFEDIVYDLETGAVEVRHPELLPQLSRDR